MNGGVFQDRAQVIEMLQSGCWWASFSTSDLKLFYLHLNQSDGTTEPANYFHFLSSRRFI